MNDTEFLPSRTHGLIGDTSSEVQDVQTDRWQGDAVYFLLQIGIYVHVINNLAHTLLQTGVVVLISNPWAGEEEADESLSFRLALFT